MTTPVATASKPGLSRNTVVDAVVRRQLRRVSDAVVGGLSRDNGPFPTTASDTVVNPVDDSVRQRRGVGGPPPCRRRRGWVSSWKEQARERRCTHFWVEVREPVSERSKR
jgi:hypothetical protein